MFSAYLIVLDELLQVEMTDPSGRKALHVFSFNLKYLSSNWFYSPNLFTSRVTVFLVRIDLMNLCSNDKGFNLSFPIKGIRMYVHLILID